MVLLLSLKNSINTAKKTRTLRSFSNIMRVCGTIKNIRKHKHNVFVDIESGNRVTPVIISRENFDSSHDQINCGASVSLTGNEFDTKGQLISSNLLIDNNCDSRIFPIQKDINIENARKIPHLRHRHQSFKACLHLRNVLYKIVIDFLTQNEFVMVNCPILTTNKCEDGCEVFSIQPQGYFRSPTHLTVSSQLHLESFLNTFPKVFHFGPVFRAEKHDGLRHLSEFWMLELEMGFVNQLDELINLAKELITYCVKRIEIEAAQDLDILRSSIGSKIDNSNEFKEMTFNEVIEILGKDHGSMDLSGMEELKLTSIFDCPIFVTHYPIDTKPFYMKKSEIKSGEAECFDLLVPNVGEIIGGGLRENDPDKLLENIKAKGLDPSMYEWYIDLRKYGCPSHGGFGLGFDRLIQFITGIKNIRDVIPFPRSYQAIKS